MPTSNPTNKTVELLDVNPQDATSWAGIERFRRGLCSYGDWIFRGQANAQWNLETSLDRLSTGVEWKSTSKRTKLDLEKGLLRKFMRHAQLYETRVPMPKDEDFLEWIALMRHYGAPTRLLDWTYSFWVALLFACLPRTDPSASRSCVWAIDATWLKEASLERLRGSGRPDLVDVHEDDRHCRGEDTFEKLYRSGHRFVLKQNCWRLNERLVAQQGVFLCPGDVECRFDENLKALEPHWGTVQQLRIPRWLQKKALIELRRMNVTEATLFPGLAGFAQSLRPLALEPAVLVP
jgi:hypothetical protein